MSEDTPSPEAIEAASKCGGCGGPYRYDISIPSGVWNHVIRANGLSEYLCGTCILYEFAKAGQSFTAQLWGDGFGGTAIEVRVGGSVAVDAALINDQNNRLRWMLRQIIDACRRGEDKYELPEHYLASAQAILDGLTRAAGEGK